MKQRCQSIRVGINARQITGLFEIAFRTRESKILQLVAATMLDWNDVLHLEPYERRCLLLSLAILAPVVRPLADELSYASFHSSNSGELQSKPSFGLKDGHQIVGLNVCFILVTFFVREFPFVGLRR